VVEDGRTTGFRMHLGGSPCNVAVALARLDAQVEFAGKASEDLFGRFLVEQLRREGVGLRWLSRSRAPSTLAFVALDGGDPSYAFYGAGAADTLLQPLDLPAAVSTSTILHFGSISLLHGPTAATIMDLVERLRGHSLLSFDPNIRPSLVHDAAAYRRTLEQMFRAADIVKLSEADVRWWNPDQSIETVATAIQAYGPVLVVVTRGARGAYARTARGETQVGAPPVRVVDTVGAGDAFTAALLVTLAQQDITSRAAAEAGLQTDNLRTALHVAAAAAALNVTRAGADPPRRRELDAFLAQGHPPRRASHDR
jgi:fructokinase